MTPTRILILGAAGSLARVAIDRLLELPDVRLTLYLRDARRLASLASDRVLVIEGDVLDGSTLLGAMAEQDIVYANLAGEMERQARSIVTAMHAAGLTRLIFVSSMGIYNESGEIFGSVLEPYRKSAALIEASDLGYTILRPAWFTDDDEVNYEITRKGERFIGSNVSRKSIADLIARLASAPPTAVRESLGIGKSPEEQR